MKFIFPFLIIMVSFLTCNCQSKQELIKAIREEFQKINSDKKLKLQVLDGEEFLDNVPDAGAELKGYSRNDSIIKIVEWGGLSYGNRTREFYFKNQKLIFVYETFDAFVFDEKSEEMDHSKTKKVFEGRYYFNNDKMIEEKLSGKKPIDEKSSPSELLAAAKEDVKILSKKN